MWPSERHIRYAGTLTPSSAEKNEEEQVLFPKVVVKSSEGLNWLQVELAAGQKIIGESGDLRYMIGPGTMTLRTKGAFAGLLTGESIFKSVYIGPATVSLCDPTYDTFTTLTLAPNESWIINRGAFVCCTDNMTVTSKRNRGFSIFFSGEGLFQTKIVNRSNRNGQVTFRSPGPVEKLQISADKPLATDGDVLIARDGLLKFKTKLFGKGAAKLFGGEIWINYVTGEGHVYMCNVPSRQEALARRTAAITATAVRSVASRGNGIRYSGTGSDGSASP